MAKYIYSVILTLLLLPGQSIAQLIPYNKQGKWGLVNVQKNIIIPTEYDEIALCGPPHARLVLANKENIFKIFDTTGHIILTFDNHYGTPMRSVGQTSNCAFIKTISIQGNIHLAVGNPWAKELLDYSGKVVIDNKIYDSIAVYSNLILTKKGDRYGVLDTNLREVLPPDYTSINFDGYWVKAYKGKSKPLILDQKTWQPLNCQVDALSMSSQYYPYFIFMETGRYGIMDSFCRVIIPPKYTEIYMERNVIYATKTDRTYDVYSQEGKLIVKSIKAHANYGDSYIYFKSGSAQFYNQWLEPGLKVNYEEVTQTGEPNYQGYLAVNQSGVTVPENKTRFHVAKNGFHGIMDTAGHLVFPLIKERYEAVFKDYAVISDRIVKEYAFTEKAKDTVTIIYQDGRRQTILLDGVAYGLPVLNRLAFLKNNKVGFVDFNGTVVVPAKFDRDLVMRPYTGLRDRKTSFVSGANTAEVKYGKSRVLIDTSGRIIGDSTLPEIKSMHLLINGSSIVQVLDSPDHFAVVSSNGEWLRKDDEIRILTEKLLAIKKGTKVALFNIDLIQLTDFAYEWIQYDYMTEWLLVSKNGQSGYISPNGIEYFE